MDAITKLNALLDDLIEFGRGHAALDNGAGRNHNPLYHPDAFGHDLLPNKLDGSGIVQSIPLSKVISRQATIHGKKVRSMKDQIRRGTLSPKSLPTVQRAGSVFIAKDGNHRLAAALRAGKRMAKVLVQ